jgi:hypothetical protein
MSDNQNEIFMAGELALSTAKFLFEKLLSAPSVNIGISFPPKTNGVYAFSIGNEIIYVGEAAGSSGLKNRILSKHVSGDEGHALQREFMIQFPDRLDRRMFIKNYVLVQWVEIPNSLMVSVVEKLAIAIIKPRLNQAVINQTNK